MRPWVDPAQGIRLTRPGRVKFRVLNRTGWVMVRLELTTHELALVAWFVEAAVVSLKESLEEQEEQEGVEDALRARDLFTLEALRESLQSGMGQAQGGEQGAAVELEAEQLNRLGRLAEDAVTLCRGKTPDSELAAMDTPPDAGALADSLAGIRDKVRAHPQYSGDTSQ
jgi:hypothetical protein